MAVPLKGAVRPAALFAALARGQRVHGRCSPSRAVRGTGGSQSVRVAVPPTGAVRPAALFAALAGGQRVKWLFH